MNYLTEDEVMDIQNTVRLLSIDDIADVSQYLFNANTFIFILYVKCVFCLEYF